MVVFCGFFRDDDFAASSSESKSAMKARTLERGVSVIGDATRCLEVGVPGVDDVVDDIGDFGVPVPWV
jgi:hypothetical protein